MEPFTTTNYVMIVEAFIWAYRERPNEWYVMFWKKSQRFHFDLYENPKHHKVTNYLRMFDFLVP